MRRSMRRWEPKVDTVYSSNTTWYLWPRFFLKLRQCSTTATLSMTLTFYVCTNVCIEKYWFRFTTTRTCSHISFLFASHSVVSRVHHYLKTDNCLRCIVLVLPTFGAHRKARQISAADRLSQHRIYFDLLSREMYTLRRDLPRLRVFFHDTNKNNVQIWHLFAINILCKWFSNLVAYRDICNERSAEDPFVFIYTVFPSFIIITL